MTNPFPTGSERKRSFPPVADARTRILVLGSLPGEASLARGRYYAHPRNQFWRLMGGIIDADLAAMDYQKRLSTLLSAGVGLWDVVGSATRTGSLDANIRSHEANPLAELAATLPNLKAVGFNGAKSASLGMKLLREHPGLALLPLSSSSPAFTLPFEAKLAGWLALRAFL